MSDRKRTLREHLEMRHAETWPVIESLSENDMSVEVYSSDDSIWTVKDLLGHLADGESGNLAMAQRLVAGEQTVPEDFDLDRWNRGVVRRAKEASREDQMQVIEESFNSALSFLKGLDDSDLDKIGLHSSLETMNTEGFLRRMVDHRHEHVVDIQKAIERSSS